LLLFGSSNKKNDDKDGGANNKKMKKTMLVTGANKGIGKAICQKLLQEYSDVVVLL
jgi:FlaA1/EpsC-like NDP-sugar epimerase